MRSLSSWSIARRKSFTSASMEERSQDSLYHPSLVAVFGLDRLVNLLDYWYQFVCGVSGLLQGTGDWLMEIGD
ncbi:MAG: hypothetical protein KME52_05200 [Desmonostoc geniculatum HA4340-LM1]|nr:hypothetical protein [Desmonostoc geniculatum HA4340-LM1]